MRDGGWGKLEVGERGSSRQPCRLLPQVSTLILAALNIGISVKTLPGRYLIARGGNSLRSPPPGKLSLTVAYKSAQLVPVPPAAIHYEPVALLILKAMNFLKDIRSKPCGHRGLD